MRKAFSLVELSIVLVILGLLVGGILAGQSLIRAAELRSVATDAQRYKTATFAFKDKYFAWPGDMANAVSFWGAADGGDGVGADCYAASSSTAATCNGNGNDVLENGNTAIGNEEFRFWQHLANAGLVQGQYTGVQYAAAVYSAMIGVNVPASKLSNSGFDVTSPGGSNTYAGDAWTSAGNYTPFTFSFGSQLTNNMAKGQNLKAEEAWNIDTKLDDGMPGTGWVKADYWAACTSAASTSDTTGTYLVNTSTLVCSLYFLMR